MGVSLQKAFDLASRRVLWAYEEKRHTQPGPPNIRNIGAIQQFASKQMTAPDRWIKATPHVVGDRVLELLGLSEPVLPKQRRDLGQHQPFRG